MDKDKQLNRCQKLCAYNQKSDKCIKKCVANNNLNIYRFSKCCRSGKNVNEIVANIRKNKNQ